jgi:Na+/serine symporter
MESNLNNVMGTHSYFYYCGTAHLLVNMFAYIAAGIKNNEKIFLSMEEHPYHLLIDCFKKQGYKDFLTFKSAKELIQNHKKSGLTGLKYELDLHISKSIKEGFYGIR